MRLLYAFSAHLRNFDFKREDLKIFQDLYMLDKDAFFIDRTATISNPFRSCLYPEYALPDFTRSNKSFQDCGLDRVAELLEHDRSLYLLWSGGIDSTFMLTCFLLAQCNLDNVMVVLNEDSVREYPKFYQRHVRPKFKHLIATEKFLADATYTRVPGLIVNAEHGDVLFGNPLLNNVYKSLGDSWLERPYSLDNAYELLRSFKIPDRSSKCFADLVALTLGKSPRPITSMADWIWWYSFNFKWQEQGLKLMPKISKDNRFTTFYGSHDFQRWSVAQKFNHDNLSSIKNTAKLVIKELTQDQEYFDNKIKFPSTSIYYAKIGPSALLEDGSRLYAKDFDPMDYYDLDNSMSKWLKIS